jgi:hypothetical protein
VTAALAFFTEQICSLTAFSNLDGKDAGLTELSLRCQLGEKRKYLPKIFSGQGRDRFTTVWFAMTSCWEAPLKV